jgi:pimeloyl-ACP methyl ester carboxylesterase
MFPHNGRLTLDGGTADYICFGKGEKTLVMIPGIGDGLKTVKGMALPFALLYRKLGKKFRVYVFSRRNELPEHFSTRDMARDLSAAMEMLGLKSACVIGISQGGMIAQWLAADHPDKVDKLVLAVTLCRQNDTVRDAIGSWCEMARKDDYRGIMMDFADRSYTPERAKKEKRTFALMGNIGKPSDFSRFLIQAESCLTHDSSDVLKDIRIPTLVIGGTEDRIVTGKASEEIAEGIGGCELYLYEVLSHGLYEEAPDFMERVAAFFG